uniref:Uncharacterized protein n=1 Tax=Syphacia muris TaxID=451379 RepID=A0A0N5ANH6_9BILA
MNRSCLKEKCDLKQLESLNDDGGLVASYETTLHELDSEAHRFDLEQNCCLSLINSNGGTLTLSSII